MSKLLLAKLAGILDQLPVFGRVAALGLAVLVVSGIFALIADGLSIPIEQVEILQEMQKNAIY